MQVTAKKPNFLDMPEIFTPLRLIAPQAVTILEKSGHGLLAHCTRVANLVACVLEKEPTLAGGINHKLIVLAAWVHDLGKSTWPKEYFMAPLHELDRAARIIIWLHPLVGADLAASLGLLPDVRMLIEQHHERLGGGGYPRGLADPHPVALLIGACDAYAACLEPRPYRPEPLPVYEALREAAKVGAPEVVRVLDDLYREGYSPAVSWAFKN